MRFLQLNTITEESRIKWVNLAALLKVKLTKKLKQPSIFKLSVHQLSYKQKLESFGTTKL